MPRPSVLLVRAETASRAWTRLPCGRVSADRSLGEVLVNRMRSGEAIPLPLTLAILRQVCEALDHAHGLRDASGQWLGIIHRDVSPANIWVSEGGKATLVASAAAQGSFGYMAPEYIMTGTLDWRADLFAVGVLAHELLTNRPLFAGGSDRETIDRVCMLEIPPPSRINPNLPPEIDGIVMTALVRDPAHRWQYAAMIRDQIQGVAQRYGLDVAVTNPALWVDLLMPRLEPAAPPPPVAAPAPVAAPPPAAPAPAPPAAPAAPSNPRVWAEAVDDGDGATRIEPMDPAMLVAVRSPDGSASIAPAASASTPVVPEPVATIEPEPEIEAPLVDRDLGPEPTHIGAMPLISFGDTPLVSKIGESPRLGGRTSAPTLQPPIGTFLREPTAPGMPRNRRIAIIVGIFVVLAAVVVILLAVR